MDDAPLAAWLSTPIGTFAKAYVPSFKVFPCHGVREDLSCTCGYADCKNIGKHPFTKHGVKDASGDIEEVARMFQYRSDLNIAVATGAPSGFFVLDVDSRKGGDESIAKLQTYGALPPAPCAKTGGGYHILFTYPGFKVVNRSQAFGPELPGLDIRGDGGYIIAVPSRHASGKYYEWVKDAPPSTPDAPTWLLDMLKVVKKEERKPITQDHSTGARSEWGEDEVWKMLDHIDSDSDYDTWLHIGMALQSGGFKLSQWDAWSRLGEKYQNGDCENRWHGFNANHGITMGTLVDQAKLGGWKPTPIERPPVDTSAVEPLVKKAQEKLKPKPKPQSFVLGFDAMEVPGLIGDTVRWITKYAMRRQPELALFNTIAFAGSVFGRRYCSALNTRTNLYMIGVAGTGDGKDHSRKAIKQLAHSAQLDERIGADDIRSDAGLLRGLMANPAQLMMIDEFGHFLQAISNDKAPHYVRSQIGVLLKLYSHSNSVYNHGDYADASGNIIIECPNLCIYGTTTEEKYAKSLKRSAIESGELNRFVVIKARSDKAYPDRDRPDFEMDDELVRRWNEYSPKFGDSLGEVVNNSNIAPDPVKIKWGKCDDIRYEIECRQIDRTSDKSDISPLWGRSFENTVKIAMIMAIARNRREPEFEVADFDIAQLIVDSSAEYLTSLARDHIGETPQEDSNIEIVKAIKDAGGKMGRRDIMRKFRKLKKRELDDIISGLIEQEIIDAEKITDGGRPKTVYKLMAA
jgi:hypothetical protein